MFDFVYPVILSSCPLLAPSLAPRDLSCKSRNPVILSKQLLFSEKHRNRHSIIFPKRDELFTLIKYNTVFYCGISTLKIFNVFKILFSHSFCSFNLNRNNLSVSLDQQINFMLITGSIVPQPGWGLAVLNSFKQFCKNECF